MTGELRCWDCDQWFYSAAAQEIIERGERCEYCGGPLRHAERRPLRIRPLRIQFVGVRAPTNPSLN